MRKTFLKIAAGGQIKLKKRHFLVHHNPVNGQAREMTTEFSLIPVKLF
jgi:hypothetical protein